MYEVLGMIAVGASIHSMGYSFIQTIRDFFEEMPEDVLQTYGDKALGYGVVAYMFFFIAILTTFAG